MNARYYKDGSEILISRGEGEIPRRLTPRECARLQGYPEDFKIVVSDKLDAIAACDKVSYCVMDEGYRNEGEWALNINSVVVFGRIRIVDDEEYLQKELTNAYQRVNCLELTIEHMTGKLVNES